MFAFFARNQRKCSVDNMPLCIQIRFELTFAFAASLEHVQRNSEGTSGGENKKQKLLAKELSKAY